MRFDKTLLAVIVLYKTRLSDSKTFVSLTESLKAGNVKLDIIIYDNSPDYNQDIASDLLNWQITYIPDTNNSGVSKAYNLAAEIASQSAKKWLLLFDQDTIFPLNSIQIYISAIKGYPGKQLFAPVMRSKGMIISPCHYQLMRGRPLKRIVAGIHTLDQLSLINCGLCINLDAFHHNGGYNELLKLDFSDHDFIRRFKKNVANEFVLISLEVGHELSSNHKNSKGNDLNRFDYYLEGAKNMSASPLERALLRFNATIRALKLSIVHHNSVFLVKALKRERYA